MTIADWLRAAQERLEHTHCPDPAIDARWIAEDVLHMNRSELHFEALNALSREQLDVLNADLERRAQGEPVQYILNRADFMGLKFYVDERVLIPRQDTEIVVERALSLLDGAKSPRILDLCCGSGAIGIALLKNIPGATGVFADISAGALRVCRKNIENLGLAARTQVLTLDALEPAPATIGHFDLIACNPPYISADEMLTLPVDVAGFEPHDALYGGYDVLSFYRAISTGFYQAVRPGGVVIFECGAYQGFEVAEILKNSGYEEIARHLDYNKMERAVSARVPMR